MAGPRMTMNIAGKMKATVGKSILIGAFIAFSSAAACRFRRVSTACTRRMRPSEMPSWSAWMIARTNADELRRVDAMRQLLQRVLPRLADAHLAEREPELVDQRAVHVLDELRDRRVEAEARLDADGEQVECIRAARPAPHRAACRAREPTTKPGAM